MRQQRSVIIISALLGAMFFGGVAGATTIQGAKSQLQAVSSQMAKVQGKVTNLQAQITSVQGQLNVLNANLHQALLHEETLRAELTANQNKQRIVKGKLSKLQTKLNTNIHLFRSQLRNVEMNGKVNFLAVLMGSNSFSDFLSRISMLRQIGSYQHKLIVSITQEKNTETTLAHQIFVQGQVIARLTQQATTVYQQIQSELTMRTNLMNQLVSNKKQAIGYLGLLQSQKSALVQEIHKLEQELQRGLINSSQLRALVRQIAAQYGIPAALVDAVIVQESGGNAKAHSYAGAQGLMQLEPGTAQMLGVKNAYNPVQNIQGGIAYLSQLLQMFHGNVAFALAAYNAGPGAVQKYHGIPPYQQTQQYVANILRMAQGG